jgi:hypothetical protein
MHSRLPSARSHAGTVYEASPGCALRVEVRNTSAEETSIWGSRCDIISGSRRQAPHHEASLRLRDRFGRKLPCEPAHEKASRAYDKRVAPGAVTNLVFDVAQESDLNQPYFGADPRPFDGDLAYLRPLLVESVQRAERYGPYRRTWLRTE